MDGIDLAHGFVHYPGQMQSALCRVHAALSKITFVSMGNEFIQLLYLTDTTPSDIISVYSLPSYDLY